MTPEEAAGYTVGFSDYAIFAVAILLVGAIGLYLALSRKSRGEQ